MATLDDLSVVATLRRGRAVLYRHYDRDDVLLYVGISLKDMQRLAARSNCLSR